MNEMMGYLFQSVRITNDSVEHISKALQSQVKVNRATKRFMRTALIFMVATTGQIIIQNREIDRLKRDVRDLKRDKGATK